MRLSFAASTLPTSQALHVVDTLYVRRPRRPAFRTPKPSKSRQAPLIPNGVRATALPRTEQATPRGYIL